MVGEKRQFEVAGEVVELELCLVVRTEKAVSYLERACTAVEEET